MKKWLTPLHSLLYIVASASFHPFTFSPLHFCLGRWKMQGREKLRIRKVNYRLKTINISV
ncbi:hypothetical protein HMPREF9151_01898 [Hoylesella saccharolytica F0055]|uniref:Uncharacterized protein n=1 Tax=Hoylesella saccharolytica F0055 TaxID=1127699 RepID=L1N5K7_9BACT|nr:hypothetical protein HMPREF9151_01898 [Hoylesella saccharolytica F0055]